MLLSTASVCGVSRTNRNMGWKYGLCLVVAGEESVNSIWPPTQRNDWTVLQNLLVATTMEFGRLGRPCMLQGHCCRSKITRLDYSDGKSGANVGDMMHRRQKSFNLIFSLWSRTSFPHIGWDFVRRERDEVGRLANQMPFLKCKRTDTFLCPEYNLASCIKSESVFYSAWEDLFLVRYASSAEPYKESASVQRPRPTTKEYKESASVQRPRPTTKEYKESASVQRPRPTTKEYKESASVQRPRPTTKEYKESASVQRPRPTTKECKESASVQRPRPTTKEYKESASVQRPRPTTKEYKESASVQRPRPTTKEYKESASVQRPRPTTKEYKESASVQRPRPTTKEYKESASVQRPRPTTKEYKESASVQRPRPTTKEYKESASVQRPRPTTKEYKESASVQRPRPTTKEYKGWKVKQANTTFLDGKLPYFLSSFNCWPLLGILEDLRLVEPFVTATSRPSHQMKTRYFATKSMMKPRIDFHGMLQGRDFLFHFCLTSYSNPKRRIPVLQAAAYPSFQLTVKHGEKETLHYTSSNNVPITNVIKKLAPIPLSKLTLKTPGEECTYYMSPTHFNTARITHVHSPSCNTFPIDNYGESKGNFAARITHVHSPSCNTFPNDITVRIQETLQPILPCSFPKLLHVPNRQHGESKGNFAARITHVHSPSCNTFPIDNRESKGNFAARITMLSPSCNTFPITSRYYTFPIDNSGESKGNFAARIPMFIPKLQHVPIDNTVRVKETLQPVLPMFIPQADNTFPIDNTVRVKETLQPVLPMRGCGAERLACSPPTNVNQVQSGPLLDFRMWESCRTMPLVSGFSRGSPVSPPLHSGATTYSLKSPSSALKDLAVKSRRDLTQNT
ncbi:hypothetical protein PR048_032061 [Dryococelus australis]|uniref:Uncharacterized protein n=1 Tax=Dryococelus australis TaxID=614101 RepID=A0ABQ9G4E8_9NEOP|nr:hypothetical protein PR048_032061 [Dryococelus australis]